MDLAIVNLMTVVVMIPVITAGPALAAMNNSLIHMVRKDGPSVWKTYRKALKQNMRQGILLGLIFLGAGSSSQDDLLLLHSIDSKASTVLMIIITVLGICAFVIGIYAFALLSRYENTIRGTLLNAVRLALGHIPRSLAMAVLWAVWAVFLWYIHGIALLVYVIYGLSIPAGACTLLYDPIFREMEADMEEDRRQIQRMISSKSITEYEQNSAELSGPLNRPAFHLTPPIGWMNDPNGFSRFNGKYHLFYQYHPFNTDWGEVSWGHAVSSDLLRWEQYPPALAPDQVYDAGGCFSGTAIECKTASRC